MIFLKAFLRAAPQDAARVAVLADEIWRECYAELLETAQIDYMLEKFQSVSAIQKQMEYEGYEYYLIRVKMEDAGYFALHPEGTDVFLSKLYLKKKFRGMGLSRAVIEDIGKRFDSVYLTVNKQNIARAAYDSMGFSVTEEVKTDIGSGFFMDDFIMRKVFRVK